ncbi:MAG: GerW family sporulation protein [Bacillota bacterium]|nr:GerW family sporulation protein [Bacillota bacterium]
MNKGNINDMIGTIMESIKEVVKVSSVVGDAVNAPDGSIVIPVTKVTCGFGATGVEIPAKSATKEEYPFGGGSGGGLSIEPMGFMVMKEGNVRVVPMIEEQTTIEKVIDMVPSMVDKLNSIVKSYTEKAEKKTEKKEAE